MISLRTVLAGVSLTPTLFEPGTSLAQQSTLPTAVFMNIYQFGQSSQGPAYPAGGDFILGRDGNFYGTTDNDGTYGKGTLYRVSTSGLLQVIHSFSGSADGANPQGPLAQDQAGDIYGTTQSITAFRYELNGAYTSFGPLVQPAASNGIGFAQGLIYASDGNFYGTVVLSGGGELFRLTPQGVSTIVSSFLPGPQPTIFLQHPNGNLYGLMYTNTGRTLFTSITLDGTMTTIADLTSTQIADPANSSGNNMILGTDGNFYFDTSIDLSNLVEVSTAGVVNESGDIGAGILLQGTDGYIYMAEGNTISQIGEDFKFTQYQQATQSDAPGPGAQRLRQGPDGSLYLVTDAAISKITLIPASNPNPDNGSGPTSDSDFDSDSSAGDGYPDDGSGGDYGVPTALGDPENVAGSPCAGDPVCVASGNLFETVTDYQTTGTNQLSFTRYYNSIAASNTYASSLGPNWRSNYDRYLQIGVNTVVAERADGQRVTFNRIATRWITDPDIDLQLLNSGTVWSITDSNDTAEVYTSISAGEAQLTSIQARNGYTQKLQYGPGNQLASVTDSFSRTLSFTYSGGQLQSVTTPDGLVLTYGFTGSLLTSVNYSTSPATSQTYLYENPLLASSLTGIIDENGNRYATWTYDSSGRVLTSQNGNGASLTAFAYNPDGSRTITNALGEQELYKFITLFGVSKVSEIDRLASASIPAATRTFAYDANGYVRSSTDWNGNLTTFVNDSRGEPTTINEGAGTPQARITNIQYHPIFHLPVQIVTQGLTTTFKYDFNGELLTKTQTDTTTTTVPYSTSGQTRTWTDTWSNFLLASTQTARTDVAGVTQFTYDGSGALTATTNALGQSAQTTQHLPGGLPTAAVDANGVNTSLTYDTRQRLLTTTISTAAGPLTTSYAYDAAGNRLSVTNPDGSQIINSYDSAHRLTGYTDLFNQSVAYTLDAMGNRTQTATMDANGNLQRTHSAVYDALGRLQQDIGGAGQTTTYAYDSNGNAITVTDPLGRVTQRTFDALNRLVSVTDPNGNVTTTTYDAHNRPISVTGPNGGVTTYVYDGFGELIQIVSPDSGTAVTYYDADGNQTQRIDANGATVNFTYDALDRVVTASYPGDAAENVTYSYDQGTLGVTRLTGLTDAAGTVARTYDEGGNLLTETRTNGAASLATAYTYDPAGRVASVTYPSGWSAVYARDAMGRVAGLNVQAPDGTVTAVIASAGYQPFGPVNSLVYGNGVTETRAFDPDYRITGVMDAGTAAIQNLTYAYDAANNVSAITDGVTNANSQAFQYDSLDRMTGAAGGYGNYAYSYDSMGNRLSLTAGNTATAYSYAAHSNQLAGLGAGAAAQPIGSDKAGNIVTFSSATGAATTAAYNQAGRLASVMAGNNLLAQYTYDAIGQRVARVGAVTATTFFQYDPGGFLLEETDGGGNAQADYIYLDSTPIATLSPSGGQIYFLHNDRLGTPQTATDIGQNIVWTANYGPFGELSTTPSLIVQNLRLPGQEFDANTGFYHNGFRDYAPQWGRYLQSDPLGLVAGINTYQYVLANPMKLSDRKGLLSKPLPPFLTQIVDKSLDYAAEKVAEVGIAKPITELINEYIPPAIQPYAATYLEAGITAVTVEGIAAPPSLACVACVAATFNEAGSVAVQVQLRNEALGGAFNSLVNVLGWGSDSSGVPYLSGIANPMSPDWGPDLSAYATASTTAPTSNSSGGGNFTGPTFGFYVSDYLPASAGQPCQPR